MVPGIRLLLSTFQNQRNHLILTHLPREGVLALGGCTAAVASHWQVLSGPAPPHTHTACFRGRGRGRLPFPHRRRSKPLEVRFLLSSIDSLRLSLGFGWFVWALGAEFCCTALADLEAEVLLFQSPECWQDRGTQPHPAAPSCRILPKA